MKLRTLPSAQQLKGQRILLRLDLNVAGQGTIIQDDYKIISILPTLQKLRSLPIIIVSHRGEPSTRGKKYTFTNKYSLAPVVKRLKKYLGGSIFLASGSFTDLKKQAASLKAGDIMVVENIRFWPGEIKNDQTFAKQLASLATIYVNDAFAVSHRQHASVAAITKYLPSYAGPLVMKEFTNLTKVKKQTSVVMVFGGAKISDKLPLIETFLPRSKVILVGGGIANAFLKARGVEIGKSYYETKSLAAAKRLRSRKIMLPIDVVQQNGKKISTTTVNNIKKVAAIYDIGPQTAHIFARHIQSAKTIIWNGPLGLFEKSTFRHGTKIIAEAIAKATKQGAFSVAGGGETVEALRKMNLTKYFSFVSTGGGATLYFLSGKDLPGLKGLKR